MNGPGVVTTNDARTTCYSSREGPSAGVNVGGRFSRGPVLTFPELDSAELRANVEQARLAVQTTHAHLLRELNRREDEFVNAATTSILSAVNLSHGSILNDLRASTAQIGRLRATVDEWESERMDDLSELTARIIEYDTQRQKMTDRDHDVILATSSIEAATRTNARHKALQTGRKKLIRLAEIITNQWTDLSAIFTELKAGMLRIRGDRVRFRLKPSNMDRLNRPIDAIIDHIAAMITRNPLEVNAVSRTLTPLTVDGHQLSLVSPGERERTEATINALREMEDTILNTPNTQPLIEQYKRTISSIAAVGTTAYAAMWDSIAKIESNSPHDYVSRMLAKATNRELALEAFHSIQKTIARLHVDDDMYIGPLTKAMEQILATVGQLPA